MPWEGHEDLAGFAHWLEVPEEFCCCCLFVLDGNLPSPAEDEQWRWVKWNNASVLPKCLGEKI